jgi:hypothetical protein
MFALTHLKVPFLSGFPIDVKKATQGWLLGISQTKRKKETIYIER